MSKQTIAINNYFRLHGIRQITAAERIGINAGNLSNILNDKRPIGASTAMKMHEEFGFDYHFLMTGEGELFAHETPQATPAPSGTPEQIEKQAATDKENALLAMCRDLLDQVMALRVENCDLREKLDKLRHDQ